MKKYRITYLIFMMFVSCTTEYLDVTPRNELTDHVFWQSENDADLALAGAYRGWESSTNILFLDAATDNGFEQHGFGYRQIANGQANPFNLNQGFWGDEFSTSWFNYSRIYKYNKFLSHIGEIEMNEEKKKRYIAEVRFLRAF